MIKIVLYEMSSSACCCYTIWQAALFKEDFDNERRDKERALSEKDSLMKQTTTLMNEVRSLRAQVRPPRPWKA